MDPYAGDLRANGKDPRGSQLYMHVPGRFQKSPREARVNDLKPHILKKCPAAAAEVEVHTNREGKRKNNKNYFFPN